MESLLELILVMKIITSVNYTKQSDLFHVSLCENMLQVV